MKKRMKSLTEEELWVEIEDDNTKAVNELVERYMPLVNSIVHKTRVGLPAHVDADDLRSVGMMGLYDAIVKYEDQGNRFGTYAKFRVRGSIIDYLRSVDHGTRSMRKSERDVRNAVEILTAVLQAEPSNQDICDFMEISLDELHEINTAVYAAQHISFSTLDQGQNDSSNGYHDHSSGIDLIDDSSYVDSMLEVDDTTDRLANVFASFSQQEQSVLALYYISDRNLKEIGEMLGVTESRACQIYTRTLDRIYEPLALI